MEWESKCRFKDLCASDNSMVRFRPSSVTWKRRAC